MESLLLINSDVSYDNFIFKDTDVKLSNGFIKQKDSGKLINGVIEYYKQDILTRVVTICEGKIYGELDLLGSRPVWGVFAKAEKKNPGFQSFHEDIEDIYVMHQDQQSKFLTKNGKLEGVYEAYDKHGNVIVTEIYQNGVFLEHYG